MSKLNVSLIDGKYDVSISSNNDGTKTYEISQNVYVKGIGEAKLLINMTQDSYGDFVNASASGTVIKDLLVTELSLSVKGEAIVKTNSLVLNLEAEANLSPDSDIDIIPTDSSLSLAKLTFQALIPIEDAQNLNFSNIEVASSASAFGISTNGPEVWAQDNVWNDWQNMTSEQQAKSYTEYGPGSNNWNNLVSNNIEKYNNYMEDVVGDSLEDGNLEYFDGNSAVINKDDGSKIIFNKIDENNIEKYTLDNNGDLTSYETKDANGEYQEVENSINSDLEILLQLDKENQNNTSDDYGDGILLAENEYSGDKTDATYDFTDTNEEPISEYTREEIIDGYRTGSKIGSTIGGQIGSLVISNGNYSNIEKLAISTVSTVAFQNVGEYIALEQYNQNGSQAYDNVGGDTQGALTSAVVSFAVSEYFSKNDNISDILGMEGTFVGDFADFTVTAGLGYAAGTFISQGFDLAATSTAMNSMVGATQLTTFQFASAGAVGGYLGSALANEIMGWDTKEEAMGAAIGSAIGSTIAMVMVALMTTPVGWVLAALYAFGGSFIGNIIGGIIGGLFGGTPPPPTADAEFEFDEENLVYNLTYSDEDDGGNEEAMIAIGESLGNQLVSMFTIPGGQLIETSVMPDIVVHQNDENVTLNGISGTFDDVNDSIAQIISPKLPFINVENGDPYILRALNRTNEEFLEAYPDYEVDENDLAKIYENVELARAYSDYMNEQIMLVDSNGNAITDADTLSHIDTQYFAIESMEEGTAKDLALEEFLQEYSFVSKKEYVDNLFAENINTQEIEYWEKVFALVEELQLDEAHYSEDFNKLNHEIAQYNYEVSEENGDILDIDYDDYLRQIEDVMLAIINPVEIDETTTNNTLINKNITVEQANAILEEIGYSPMAGLDIGMLTGIDSMIAPERYNTVITPERFSELLELSGIENPYENLTPVEDAFSFKGKSLNDLQFELENGNLTIRTFDKDLEEDIALEKSQEFVIEDWESWSKEDSFIDLPDGTKVNLQALLELIGVEEGAGLIDVNEAFMNIALENENIESYLEEHEFNKVVVGTSQDDIIKTYFGDNLIITGEGENTIITGSGDDIIFADQGTNTISAGEGNDTVSYELSDTAVYTSLEDGGISGIALGDTYEGIENLTGSDFDDSLTGDDNDNILSGKAGNDILNGGSGSDTLDGGEGIDLASYESSAEAVQINLENDYTYGGEATGDSLSSIEGIYASQGDDVLVGDDNQNIIYANEGDDRISTNAGDDLVFAGDGDDYVKGDEGDDTLYGELGDDVLIGGAGDDILYGGAGKNTLLGDEGNDIVVYSGLSTEYDILFVDENTILVKSQDGDILDTLKDIEEISFDDALFTVDYENKTLIKKVTFDGSESEVNEVNSTSSTADNSTSQAATIATAIMVGTVAAAETVESSTDEMNYLSDDPGSLLELESTVTSQEIISAPVLSEDNPLYDYIQLIKEHNTSVTTMSNEIDEENFVELDNSDSLNESDTVEEPNEEITQTDIITAETIEEDVTLKIEEIIAVEEIEEDESLVALTNPQITLNETVINEDTNLFGIEILNSNSNTTMQIVFFGVPDTFILSAGEKRDDGNWYLSQNDLLDLQIIPETNNADDFDITIKAIVSDSHGRVISSEITETIQIIAVADTPILNTEDSLGDEDTAIPLVISTSLVDDLAGVDGEESIVLSIENVPDEAVLSAGSRDTDGIWYLLPSELESLTITPYEHNADDFTITVTAYAIESENGDIASISEDIFIEVTAIADTPTLDTSDSLGDEDTQIALNISSELIDKDGSENLNIKIEDIPNGAILNHGTKDSTGVWHLLSSELESLTITPSAHDSSDFTIKVTAYSTEEENNDSAQIVQDIFVEVTAVADEVILDTFQPLNNRDDLIETSEDISMIQLQLSSEFIDLDGSESVHYLVEGLPDGTTLNNGTEISSGTWKLEIEELDGLAMFLTENSDENFQIKVSAVTTESENADQMITSKILDVAIDSIADFAILNVSNANGMENDFIALDIQSSLTDTDGSETLSIIIEDVPSGAVLNNGIKQSDGTWHLSQEDLTDLQIRPEFNSTTDFEIKIRAISTEAKNADTQESIGYIKVNVEAIPTSVGITVEQMEILEDEEGFLSIIVDESTLHPSESMYLELQLEEGTSLSQGEQLNDTTWKLRTDQLSNLSLTTIPNYSGSFSIDITSVIVESTGIERRSEYPIKLPVDIIAVADEATLDVTDISVNEDSLIYFNINSKLQDLDGSESLQLKISGIPDDALLSAGEKSGGIWVIENKDISSLAMLPPENFSGDLNLSIEAISTDSNGDTNSELKNITISLNEVIDQPILNVSDAYIKEGESYLAINSFLKDIDGSESLSIEIEGIPNTATLSAGIKNSDGTYVLTKDELTDLRIVDLDDSDFTINVRSISTDGVLSQSIEKSIEIKQLDIEENPFMYINNLSISSQTDIGETLIFSGADDIVQSGGGSDIIQTNGGSDIIESDTSSGNIFVSFYLDAASYKTDGSENIIFNIENLPEGFTSNVGYLNNDILVIESSIFDGNIELTYPYTESSISLKITANAISTDTLNPYTRTTDLDLLVEVDEVFGNDFVDAGSNDDIVNGEEGDDIILGGSGNDYLIGSDGDDYINGGSGVDKIDAGAGDDYIIMDSEDFESNSFLIEQIDGGEGFDTLVIQDDEGVNFDMGLTSIENFIGTDGDDNIIGSDGDDIVKGSLGADTYYTLDGDDTVYIDADDIQAQSGNFVDTGTGYDKIYIEDSSGVTFDVADTNSEELISGDGDDILLNTSNETMAIYGMQGDDRIYASSSVDTLDGGEGIDTIDYSNSDFGVTVNLETNSASGGYAQNDIINNFENIIGSSKDDNLTGNNTDNIIYAGDGNNIIDGLDGDDTVVFDGELKEYFNGKDIKNIVTNFDTNATIFTSNGINELTNIERLQFDDYLVYIDGTNNLPFVYDDDVYGTEDTNLYIDSQTLLSNDFDLEEDGLTIVGVKNSTNGSVILNENGTITFNPNANYNSSINNVFDTNSALYKGEAGFEYIVEDAAGSRSTAYVEVNISAVNDAPVVTNHYFNLTGDITGKGRFTVSDVDSNLDSISIKEVSSVLGYTNINGRTFSSNGEFYFDYEGIFENYYFTNYYDMREFTVQISDEGDPLTGNNIQSVFAQTGAYVNYEYDDPVVIDLDGDGIEIESYHYDYFDKSLLGVGADDAILVWDKDEDGTISSREETNWSSLSEEATNDIEALRDVFDTNKDGLFDDEDKQWNQFALWQDKNMNGLVDEDEFTNIMQSDIWQINLETDFSQEATFPIEEYASYTNKEGNTYSIGAAYLETTVTEEKLSEEDKLILEEAIILNEQLASTSSINNDEYEISDEIELFNNEQELEENIA